MIAIEPAPSNFSMGATLRKRELSQFLSCAAKAIGLAGEVSVLLTGDERIRSLNKQFRGMDKPTDVLSFQAAPAFSANGHAGDLAISLETAQHQAVEYGHSLQTEVKVLLLHGLLHLGGFDHETDSGEMARRELELRRELDLPAGLTERVSSTRTRGARKNTSVEEKGEQARAENRTSPRKPESPKPESGKAKTEISGTTKKRSTR
jgi:probable rRNA maturation factor